jgi:hypothetical protein
MEKVTEEKGRLRLSWDKDRVRLEIDISRRVAVTAAVLVLCLYSPRLFDLVQRIVEIVN